MRRLTWFLVIVLASTATWAVKPLWQYNGASSISQEPVINTDGSVFFATDDGKLRALNPSGLATWSVNPGGDVVTPLLIHNGSIFMGNSAHELRAYGFDGHLVWKMDTGINISTQMAMSGGSLLWFATGDGFMHAVNALNGTELWKYKAGSAVGPPTVGHDGTVYFAGDNYVHRVDPASWKVLWSENFFNFSMIPIVMDQYDDIFYIRGGILDVYDFNGNFLWEGRDATGNLLLIEKVPPVIVGDTMIVTVTGGGDFLGLSVLDGSILWDFTTVNTNWTVVSHSPLAVDDTGRLYYCDAVGEFTWIDASTGALLGYMPTQGAGAAVNLMGMDTGWYLPVSDLRGLVVVRDGPASRVLSAYAVEGGPAYGPWPQWGGTAFHQGRRDDPPDLYLTSPVDGTVITGPFSTLAQASDDFRLQNMSCYLNNTRMFKTSGGYLAWGADSGLFEDGFYTVSVIARDSGGNRAVAQATVEFINPPPVYGVSGSAPIFSWISNGVDSKYEVDVSMDPNFTSILATSATKTQQFKKSTSWQPKDKQWQKVTDAAVLSPTIQTTFYWRVIGKSGGLVVQRTFILDKTR